MKKILDEYKDFVNKGNVVTIAVGLVMALYFKTIIDAFVNGLIMPIVSLIFGKTDFTTIGFYINDTFFGIGLVIQAVIVFFIVAWVLFLIIKLYNRYLAKPIDEEDPAITEVALLTEIRDELRARG